MSLQTNPSAENRDNIESQNLSPENKLTLLEEQFIQVNNLSVKTLEKLISFISQKKSLDILNNSQDNLLNLKDFIQISNISESEKKSLNNISKESFQLFANEVFTQLESSKKQLSQLDTYIHGEHNECIASSQNNGYISDQRFSRANNPTKPHHHLDGCLAGITNSTVAIGQGTIKLARDTIKAPYDAYLILTNQATTNDFENT